MAGVRIRLCRDLFVFDRVGLTGSLLDVAEATTTVLEATSKLGLGSELSIHCDVVVGEFAHFGVVDTDDFALLVCSKSAARDEVHDPENDSGHNERIRNTGDRVGELVTKLNVVVIKPATGDGGKTVEAGDGGLSEEASADVADNTTDSVSGEDIEAVIVVEDELELSCPIASSATKNAESNGSR